MARDLAVRLALKYISLSVSIYWELEVKYNISLYFEEIYLLIKVIEFTSVV